MSKKKHPPIIPPIAAAVPDDNALPMKWVKVNHHSPEHLAARYPMASFGSNLSFAQIAQRCKTPELVGPGKVIDARLAFVGYSDKGVATMIADEGSTTLVGVYKMDAADIERMDRFEGMGRVYDRMLVTVMGDDGVARRCMTYLHRHPDWAAAPTDKYVARVLEGYRDWSFEDRRIRHARKRAIKDQLEYVLAKKKSHQFFDYDPIGNGSASDYYRNTFEFDNYNYNYNYNNQMRRNAGVNVAPITSLVTGRTLTGRAPDSTDTRVFITAPLDNIEWGKRRSDQAILWRYRGGKQWYLDATTKDDERLRQVRGYAIRIDHIAVDGTKKAKNKQAFVPPSGQTEFTHPDTGAKWVRGADSVWRKVPGSDLGGMS